MLLGVNIDHVATLRNARGGNEPDVLSAALVCQDVEAHGITIHLREDRRHIKDADLKNIMANIKCNINLEMAATDEMQKIALEAKPQYCCIVPENRKEITTEGGLDVASQLQKITEFVKPLVEAGIKVSLFIDADKEQIIAASKTGAQYIELHTGRYSEAFGTNNEEAEFLKLKEAAELGQSLGLKVNAGHGLNYDNVSRMHEINDLKELNIGHSIISKAVFIGLKHAIIEMQNLIK